MDDDRAIHIRPDRTTEAVADAPAPTVTVVIANYNGAAFIEAALLSALAQSLRNIEVLVADDASTDDSPARVEAIARRDGRVRLLRSATNGGPAAARNRCLDAAHGQWIAILDSDDLMHPQRLEWLVAAAERDAADIAADDLLIFHDEGAIGPATCLDNAAASAPFWVDLPAYVRGNALFGGGRALGYLKPVIRSSAIRRDALRYDPSLRIAEDYDFIFRLLAGGARFRVYPTLTYFYRKHGRSISHRLSRATLEPMLQAHDRAQAAVRHGDPGLRAAMAERQADLQRALDFDRLVETLKRRDWRGALAEAARRPRVAALLRGPVLDRLRRLAARRGRQTAGMARRACVISRQRIVGNTNGSSVYLLSLCAALAGAGYEVHLVCPSPAVFGRWPAMRLQPEMRLFRAIAVRGSVRVGQLLVAVNPAIAVRAASALLGLAASRLGVAAAGRWTRPAPYAVSVPWTRADRLFVAAHAAGKADVVIADYAFLADGIPYALRPDAPSIVVMHDLFSSRSAQFDRLGAADSVALVDEATEMAMLGRADAVVAIQEDEAAIVRRNLAGRRVITVPMAITPVAQPQPGAGSTVLFVGSKTAPNVFGLQWFVDAIWPAVREAVPDAVLLVAGTVGRTVAGAPEGVRLLGVVPDLAALYRDAAVVVSPLQAGSGLKIKLVEALGHGKAVVATSTTLQGVDALVRDAVAVADTAEAFAAAVVDLLTDGELRLERCSAALAVARARFSTAGCYQELLDFVGPGRAFDGGTGA